MSYIDTELQKVSLITHAHKKVSVINNHVGQIQESTYTFCTYIVIHYSLQIYMAYYKDNDIQFLQVWQHWKIYFDDNN